MEIDINTQELLELALFTLSALNDDEIQEDDPRATIALDVLAQYVLLEKPEATPEEVIEEIQTMETEYILNSLVNKGMIDREFSEDGEVRYSATDLGRSVAKDQDDEVNF